MAGVRLLVMILDELRKVASGLQGKCAPVPWGIEGMGELGHMTRERGLYLNPAYTNPLHAALSDAAEYERVSREVSGGKIGGDVLVPLARQISDCADVVRTIRGMRSALTSWDQIVTAQSTGKAMAVPVYRSGVGTASVWELDFAKNNTVPGPGSFTAIPGGGVFNGSSTGAITSPAFTNIGASDHLYLTNIDMTFAGTPGATYSILGVIDLLVGAGNINAATATSQNISTTALPRWTTGEGLCMSLVVTTALVGGTAPTIAITYTDQSGNTANSTGAIAVTTGALANRLLPVQDGPMIRLASPDTGVRVVEACIITGTITSGALAAFIYKPISFMGIVLGLPTTRTTPAQTGGFRRVTESVGNLPCLTTIRYASASGQSALAGFLEFAWG